MSAMAGQQVQTLGACLSNLAPGDRCPCCGARLERVPLGSARRDKGPQGRLSATAAVATRSHEVGRGDAEALLCGACGCEIDGAEEPFQACAELAFSAAA